MLFDELAQTWDSGAFSKPIDLHDFLLLAKDMVAVLPNAQVICEVKSISSKGGHYYLELAQKEGEQIIAQVKGTLWRGQAMRVLNKFSQATGVSVQTGQTLLVSVQANLHPKFGFSLNILDIDPSYTQGKIAQDFANLVAYLQTLPDFDFNRSLPITNDFRSIAVIAPDNAAGLGDFRAHADHLAHLIDFSYYHATFQGDNAPQSIVQALHDAQLQKPDLLVIIRGGGASLDLAYLNDSHLAQAIMRASVPVWVGVGHEKDHTVLDVVCAQSFDTPSKVIFGILQHQRAFVSATFNTIATIHNHTIMQAQTWRTQSDTMMRTLQRQAYASQKALDYRALYQSILQKSIAHRERLKTQTTHALLSYQGARKISQNLREKSQALCQSVLLSKPSHIMQKGYAHISQKGSVISSVCQVDNQAPLYVRLQDGVLVCKVIDENN